MKKHRCKYCEKIIKTKNKENIREVIEEHYKNNCCESKKALFHENEKNRIAGFHEGITNKDRFDFLGKWNDKI